mgnify:CR=1 FL=1
MKHSGQHGLLPAEPNDPIKINSLINSGLFIAPVTMSTKAKIHIITNAINPITAFSLIELWSLNKS